MLIFRFGYSYSTLQRLYLAMIHTFCLVSVHFFSDNMFICIQKSDMPRSLYNGYTHLKNDSQPRSAQINSKMPAFYLLCNLYIYTRICLIPHGIVQPIGIDIFQSGRNTCCPCTRILAQPFKSAIHVLSRYICQGHDPFTCFTNFIPGCVYRLLGEKKKAIMTNDALN